MADAPKLTPMMERYLEVKAQNPEAILLFRMGDFYELFHEDAAIAAKILGLTLTSRDKGSSNPVPMAGFPYHSLEGYLHKLIRAGKRVAICDQVEDPKTAKGMVRREVTRIVTPGTLTDDSLLEPKQRNFLASVALNTNGDRAGISWIDVSTGEFWCTELPTSQLLDDLARIRPSELVVSDELRHVDDEGYSRQAWLKDAEQQLKLSLAYRPVWEFREVAGRDALCKHFKVKSLEGFGLDKETLSLAASGVLLVYVQEMQKAALGHILSLRRFEHSQAMLIDDATRRSLELTRTMREGARQGTLLDVLDKTVTPMGARKLGDWIDHPLKDIIEIQRRHTAVSELLTDRSGRERLRDLLDQTYDLQRLTARLATGRCSPKDLISLAKTLSILPDLKTLLQSFSSPLIAEQTTNLRLCDEVCSRIITTLSEDPPLAVSDGGVIRTGYNAQLDEFRDLSTGGKQWIARYQADVAAKTGIPNLKVGYNKVFGYYLEVTAAHQDKIPDYFMRKQTLKNQERFITPELKEYEEKVLRADEQALALEAQFYEQLKTELATCCGDLQQSAEVMAIVDVLAGFAEQAESRRYCQPEMTNETLLEIHGGRHPVLDVLLPAGEFVPNDALLGGDHGLIQIITGPNMAGKSTYIRQAALITLMAQVGSFVPAETARIGIADRIFARVGASDELGKGQSTFMVEMTETARILNTATSSSLVILDEIGRGTSTYDGLSLAWAVTEHLHDETRCRAMFATHYHELTELTTTLKRCSNWNVSVHEHEGQVVFLHRIIPGPADKSYGIHVAQLAGVPQTVIKRAQEVLKTLEEEHTDEAGKPKVPARQKASKQKQLSLFSIPAEDHPVVTKLREVDINMLTPLQALQLLGQLATDAK